MLKFNDDGKYEKLVRYVVRTADSWRFVEWGYTFDDTKVIVDVIEAQDYNTIRNWVSERLKLPTFLQVSRSIDANGGFATIDVEGNKDRYLIAANGIWLTKYDQHLNRTFFKWCGTPQKSSWVRVDGIEGTAGDLELAQR